MLPNKLWHHTNRKFFLAIAGIIVVALLAATSLTLSISALTAARHDAQREGDLRTNAQRLFSDLEQAESNRNAYALTSDQRYFDSYHEAATVIPSELRNCQNQSEGTPSHADLIKLGPLAQQRLSLLATSVSLIQNGQTEEAVAMLESGHGLKLMQQIRPLVADIERQQNSVMAYDRGTIDSLLNLCQIVTIGTLMLTLVLAVVAFRFSQRAVEAEQQLDRTKDDFVTLASHQLRTPASGLRAILQALASGDLGPLTSQQRHFLARAVESNAREIRIIDELLNTAQADAGHLVLRPSELDVCELVAGLVAEQRTSIEAKGLTLQFKRPKQPVFIQGDRIKLAMAITNLLENARVNTESGRITVAIHHDHTAICVEVADSGAGLAPDRAAHVFDRFPPGRDPAAESGQGTGLGLYLARRVAELHHGTISVSSQEGKGARFRIELPDGRAHAA